MPLPRSAFPVEGEQLEAYAINSDSAALKKRLEARTRGIRVIIPCAAAALALAGYFQKKGFEVVHHAPAGLPIAAIGQCDIVLDSIGWSVCNSILESLVHNLPIVTLAGELMRGRHTAAILDIMGISETTARTIDEYVSIAGFLGRTSAKRAELSAEITDKKHRVYRDRTCIAALETFLDQAVRKGRPPL
jgi:hypothetical protein